MNLPIAMALVVVTYGGNVSVTQNLDDHTCAEAASVAQYGKTVEAKAADDAASEKARLAWVAQEDAAQADWERKNPKEAARCFKAGERVLWSADCGPKYGPYWASGATIVGAATISANDVRYAECVK